MAVNPAPFGFSAEYRADPGAYDGFDEYLRIEFPKLHPGWEPRFGQTSSFDPVTKRHDYVYLISGNVPEAGSHADAERKVTELLQEIHRGFNALRQDVKKGLPKPITRVWRWN